MCIITKYHLNTHPTIMDIDIQFFFGYPDYTSKTPCKPCWEYDNLIGKKLDHIHGVF